MSPPDTARMRMAAAAQAHSQPMTIGGRRLSRSHAVKQSNSYTPSTPEVMWFADKLVPASSPHGNVLVNSLQMHMSPPSPVDDNMPDGWRAMIHPDDSTISETGSMPGDEREEASSSMASPHMGPRPESNLTGGLWHTSNYSTYHDVDLDIAQ